MLRLVRASWTRPGRTWLTCHRLAQLTGQGPTSIDALMAQTINERACAGDQALLQIHVSYCGPSGENAKRPQPPPRLPNMADRYRRLWSGLRTLNLSLYYARWGFLVVAEIEKELAAVAEIPGIEEPNEAIG